MARSIAVALLLLACRASADDTRPAFRVEVAAPAACAVNAACEARIKLTALGGYKVNEEYPFKFVADKNAGVTVVSPAKFAREGDKTGTMTIQLRAQAAGTHTVSGTFKLSVCTKDVCKIESPKISFAVSAT